MRAGAFNIPVMIQKRTVTTTDGEEITTWADAFPESSRVIEKNANQRYVGAFFNENSNKIFIVPRKDRTKNLSPVENRLRRDKKIFDIIGVTMDQNNDYVEIICMEGAER